MDVETAPASGDPETDSLAQLIDDARHMPAAMLPRPRTPDGRRVIDLTSLELTIPETDLLEEAVWPQV